MSRGARRFQPPEDDSRTPWGACRRKVRYRDENAANRMLRRCERRRGGHLRAYECPSCGGWHLTRQRYWSGPDL